MNKISKKIGKIFLSFLMVFSCVAMSYKAKAYDGNQLISIHLIGLNRLDNKHFTFNEKNTEASVLLENGAGETLEYNAITSNNEDVLKIVGDKVIVVDEGTTTLTIETENQNQMKFELSILNDSDVSYKIGYLKYDFDYSLSGRRIVEVSDNEKDNYDEKTLVCYAESEKLEKKIEIKDGVWESDNPSVLFFENGNSLVARGNGVANLTYSFGEKTVSLTLNQYKETIRINNMPLPGDSDQNSEENTVYVGTTYHVDVVTKDDYNQFYKQYVDFDVISDSTNIVIKYIGTTDKNKYEISFIKEGVGEFTVISKKSGKETVVKYNAIRKDTSSQKYFRMDGNSEPEVSSGFCMDHSPTKISFGVKEDDDFIDLVNYTMYTNENPEYVELTKNENGLGYVFTASKPGNYAVYAVYNNEKYKFVVNVYKLNPEICYHTYGDADGGEGYYEPLDGSAFWPGKELKIRLEGLFDGNQEINQSDIKWSVSDNSILNLKKNDKGEVYLTKVKDGIAYVNADYKENRYSAKIDDREYGLYYYDLDVTEEDKEDFTYGFKTPQVGDYVKFQVERYDHKTVSDLKIIFDNPDLFEYKKTIGNIAYYKVVKAGDTTFDIYADGLEKPIIHKTICAIDNSSKLDYNYRITESYANNNYYSLNKDGYIKKGMSIGIDIYCNVSYRGKYDTYDVSCNGDLAPNYTISDLVVQLNGKKIANDCIKEPEYGTGLIFECENVGEYRVDFKVDGYPISFTKKCVNADAYAKLSANSVITTMPKVAFTPLMQYSPITNEFHSKNVSSKHGRRKSTYLFYVLTDEAKKILNTDAYTLDQIDGVYYSDEGKYYLPESFVGKTFDVSAVFFDVESCPDHINALQQHDSCLENADNYRNIYLSDGKIVKSVPFTIKVKSNSLDEINNTIDNVVEQLNNDVDMDNPEFVNNLAVIENIEQEQIAKMNNNQKSDLSKIMRCLYDNGMTSCNVEISNVTVSNPHDAISLDLISKESTIDILKADLPKEDNSFELENKEDKVEDLFDLSIYAYIKGESKNEVSQITETPNELEFTIDLPEDYDSSKDYYILRNHEGNVEKLPLNIDEETNTATFKSGLFSTYALVSSVNVASATVPVESVALDKTTLNLKVGETGQLNATVLPVNATNKTVTWSSSDGSVATVVNGLVKGLKEGTATINVTIDGKSASCVVTVSKDTTTPEIGTNPSQKPNNQPTDKPTNQPSQGDTSNQPNDKPSQGTTNSNPTQNTAQGSNQVTDTSDTVTTHQIVVLGGLLLLSGVVFVVLKRKKSH